MRFNLKGLVRYFNAIAITVFNFRKVRKVKTGGSARTGVFETDRNSLGISLFLVFETVIKLYNGFVLFGFRSWRVFYGINQVNIVSFVYHFGYLI